VENVSVNRLGDIMNKNVIIELDGDGFVVAVYCPDETYVVNVLDRNEWRDDCDESLDNYYRSLEEEIDNLKNCY
jgi:hypothetical protein